MGKGRSKWLLQTLVRYKSASKLQFTVKTVLETFIWTQIEDQRQQEDPDLILVDERNQQPEVGNLVHVDQRQEDRHLSLFDQILAYHDQRRQAEGLNRWEILVVLLLVFACVGPVLPVVAMVVKLLTETREEEEGE